MTRAATPDLRRRLDAATEVASIAGERLPVDLRDRLDAVVARATDRLAVAGDHTVVVLAGPTGVGKSSLFNALLGVDLATPGLRRPTTSTPTSAVVSTEPVGELMAHLGLGTWHHVAVSTHADVESLVLVDLPDHDSVVTAHRERAAQVVAVADRLLWVVDPDKYADSSVHDDLLAPLRAHAGVLTVVLNRTDRLESGAVDEVAADLRGLLRRDGLGASELVVTSASTGRGIADLRGLLARTITDHHAATDRIRADLAVLAADLDGALPPASDAAVELAGQVVPAAMTAAGIPAVVDAVRDSHRHRARRATGWPVLRRLQARGRDPLRRLGLGRVRGQGTVGTRSSRPLPHGIATATLATAVRDAQDEVTSDWPDPWARAADERLEQVVADLPVRLDRAVAATDLDDTRVPAWWVGTAVVQWLLVAATVVGAGWLLAAFVVAWFQLPDLPMPGWQGIPYATILLVGGVVAGLVVGALASQAARVGAARAGSRVRRRLQARVAEVVEDTIGQSLDAERSRARRARSHLDLLQR